MFKNKYECRKVQDVIFKYISTYLAKFLFHLNFGIVITKSDMFKYRKDQSASSGSSEFSTKSYNNRSFGSSNGSYGSSDNGIFDSIETWTNQSE